MPYVCSSRTAVSKYKASLPSVFTVYNNLSDNFRGFMQGTAFKKKINKLAGYSFFLIILVL
jgi:hypothetical protein